MKNRNKILIVEDEAILYQKMSSRLKKNGYQVDSYTKSYEEAMERVLVFEPDLVLLDIELVGEKTGIDLGKVLYNKYSIPFIYITSFGDKKTFEKALESVPELFMVKTKPSLDYFNLINQMKVVLYRTSDCVKEKKKGLDVMEHYADYYFNTASDTIKKTILCYESIVSIQTDFQQTLIRSVGRKNYLRVLDKDGNLFYYQGSLSNIELQIPTSFARISGSTIINFLGNFSLKISSNYNKILLNDDIEFPISRRYKKNVKARF